jgi:hypothetical protein
VSVDPNYHMRTTRSLGEPLAKNSPELREMTAWSCVHQFPLPSVDRSRCQLRLCSLTATMIDAEMCPRTAALSSEEP